MIKINIRGLKNINLEYSFLILTKIPNIMHKSVYGPLDKMDNCWKIPI